MKNKQKSRSSITKRFKLTKNGKLLRGHSNSRHLKNNKTKNNLRRQKEPVQVNSTAAKKIKKLFTA